jgi:hypothetical protein
MGGKQLLTADDDGHFMRSAGAMCVSDPPIAGGAVHGTPVACAHAATAAHEPSAARLASQTCSMRLGCW